MKTPFEIAKEKSKNRPCKECMKSERYNGTLFCKETGKIILPMFENIQVCRGERLK